ncbi:UbiX family flavin prenyltransferase [Metallumcola ferriviriculae]|uniref:Flavin prenyltransferase UbiX n=1 Tax=Metallumcola ferriviriculae TaxID=3039180 RepID=A0AAU0UQS6_9FIRM|nr:UbiX family flavin prenyltransferase [Desulfitibacteraceae bacterium MK1]
MKIVLGITGASGAMYGIRLLEVLQQKGHDIELIISPWAEKTIHFETDYTLADIRPLAAKVYNFDNLAAAVSSGSYHVDATVIAPCSMKTLAAIAHGYTDNLISRTADVALKEKRKLILVPRETPLNVIHLENMKIIAAAGGILLPPMPSFYHMPKTIDDIINQTIGKILDCLNISHNLFDRWGETNIRD